MTPTVVSAERQARFDALKNAPTTTVYTLFSPEDAVIAEELRTGMLAFIHEPSIGLASRFTSLLEGLERLVRTYPPIGVFTFLYRIVGFDLKPPANPGVYTFVHKCFYDSAPDSNMLDRYCELACDEDLFVHKLTDPRHPIRPEWNGNFQVYVLLGLFQAYVSKFYGGYPEAVFHNVDMSYLLHDTPSTCGLYVGFLDPDYNVRHILSDLVAPEDQLDGCEYVFSKDDTDIETYSQWDRDENWCIDGSTYMCAVVVMPYSDLVPPRYGLPLSSVQDRYFSGF
jgi:hypothetical protein